MNLTTVWPVLIGAVIGFAANGFTTYWADRRKLRYRWDEPAFAVFSVFAASVRAGRDGAARLWESLSRATTDEAVVESRERFDALHAKLRSDFEQVALIGTPEGSQAGRDVVTGVYYLRELALKKTKPHDENWKPQHTKLMNDQKRYYVAVRTQLRMPAGPDPASELFPSRNRERCAFVKG